MCPHDDDAHCACRKPRPGLLLEAAPQLGIDLSESYIVGDRWRDVEAGQRAVARPSLWITAIASAVQMRPTCECAPERSGRLDRSKAQMGVLCHA